MDVAFIALSLLLTAITIALIRYLERLQGERP
jgi:hypothetical protein